MSGNTIYCHGHQWIGKKYTNYRFVLFYITWNTSFNNNIMNKNVFFSHSIQSLLSLPLNIEIQKWKTRTLSIFVFCVQEIKTETALVFHFCLKDVKNEKTLPNVIILFPTMSFFSILTYYAVEFGGNLINQFLCTVYCNCLSSLYW